MAPLYSVKSTDFFDVEENLYYLHLQNKIDDLNMMISSLLEKLNLVEFPGQNNIIEQV